MTMPPPKRVVARTLVLNHSGQVLLVHENDPRNPSLSWWAVPGGAMADGESMAGAALRELREETGLILQTPGPIFWSRCHSFVYGGRPYRQQETFFCAWCDPDAWQPQLPTVRWWMPAELAETPTEMDPPNLLGLRELAIAKLRESHE